MNVEIGAEAALFPEKEYIKGIFVAVLKKTKLRKNGAKTSVADPGSGAFFTPGSGIQDG
jgi:hypothetical protein